MWLNINIHIPSGALWLDRTGSLLGTVRSTGNTASYAMQNIANTWNTASILMQNPFQYSKQRVWFPCFELDCEWGSTSRYIQEGHSERERETDRQRGWEKEKQKFSWECTNTACLTRPNTAHWPEKTAWAQIANRPNQSDDSLPYDLFISLKVTLERKREKERKRDRETLLSRQKLFTKAEATGQKKKVFQG